MIRIRQSISEIAKISGVSVRTLHYYDEIGLLTPNEVMPETGYRYYNKESLEKLQQNLFYKELDFTLKEITEIMNASEYNKEEALKKQKELLMLKRARLDKLIELLNANLEGETTMSFKEFDMKDIEETKAKYAKEAKERWGGTDAYKQSQEKTSKYTKEDWQRLNEERDLITKQFSERIGEDPASEKLQELVKRWQQYITDNYYDCTKEILSGLGQMYVTDERFTENMDKYAKGTAELINKAIEVYCEN